MPTVNLNEGPTAKGPDHTITFGRWKGYKVYQVAKDDPGYLVWAHNNVEFFKLNEDYLLGIEEAAMEQKENKKSRRTPMRIVPGRTGRPQNTDQDTVDRFNEQNKQRGRFGDDLDDDIPF